MELIERGAQAGDAIALAFLGKCFDYGWGVDRSSTEASVWLSRAADAGLDWARPKPPQPEEPVRGRAAVGVGGRAAVGRHVGGAPPTRRCCSWERYKRITRREVRDFSTSL